MDKLQVERMVFQGIHGRTGHETHTPQRFQVDVEATLDFSKALVSDQLSDTVDYCEIEKVVEYLVTKESHVLIETLADRIAERVLENERIRSVRVAVSKLDVFGGSQPSVVCTRDQSVQSLGLKDIDGDFVLNELICHGGVSVPILHEGRRKELVHAALLDHQYKRRPEFLERVREQVSSSSDFSADSPFHVLRTDIESLLALRMRDNWSLWDTTPFDFNDMVLQRYAKGSIGVTPHKEGNSVLNVFCIVILCGEATTALCKNRAGDDPIYLDTTPGNMLVIRGPGFLGSALQPFHFMSDVNEDRITFCLRQRVQT